MKSLLLETNKRPGVHYAFTADGIELPVIDVTHPAFALSLTDSEQTALVEKFLQNSVPLGRLKPRALRNLLLRVLLRGSILAKGIRQSQGSFMTGMHTYLLKLGPQMLGSAYAKPVDRQIAAALPVRGVRLRLQDVARLMMDTLLHPLCNQPQRPVHLIDIAGGPAIDSLNALILLHKNHPGILKERNLSIDVLDLDESGAKFGEAALAALSGETGPLHGIQVALRYIHYDWSKAIGLEPVLREARDEGALAICSSEGGLFEYGTDGEIESNLKILRRFSEVLAVIGSVTRADEPIRKLRETSAAATYPRGLAAFHSLVRKTGWTIGRAIERPFSDQVVLVRAE